jgi:hypothetical protein
MGRLLRRMPIATRPLIEAAQHDCRAGRIVVDAIGAPADADAAVDSARAMIDTDLASSPAQPAESKTMIRRPRLLR